VALVAALASDVELLLLDEPTAGLDPLMEAAFRACIEEERQRGRTVLLSSHILSEVEALCDRVTIIRRGVHDLDVEGNRVRCEVDTEQLDGFLRRLSAAGVRSLTSQPPTLEELFLRHYTVDGPAVPPAADQDGVRA
jgi:ABC-2 type transport system ATP-binding protein